MNSINNEGHSPLTILMKGEQGAKMILRPVNSLNFTMSLFDLLAKNGADMNHLYPEESLNAEKDYKCTVMINMIRHCAHKFDILKANLHCLMEFKARLDLSDTNK